MGSPATEANRSDDEQLHRVRITKPFYLGKHEVTQVLYMLVMDENPTEFPNMKGPVDFINWDNCQKFIARLNKMVPGGGFRLPTEAEWEYACRAGTKTAFFCGDDKAELGDYAWYFPNSGKRTHEVGQKKPNAWGLYDMHGNLLEWCADRYAKYEFPAGGVVTDPTGPAGGRYRVLRGGCWNHWGPTDDAKLCRAANRYPSAPDARMGMWGFRLVLDLK
jgi:formylglycine-generating enzyme required for sulfatase activity